MPFRRFCAAAFSCAVSFAPFAASANDVDPAVAKRHVNLSALQPMLAEQIAKSACFAAIGVNTSANVAYLGGAYRLFESTRQGLRDGSDALGLEAETSRGMISALDRLDSASSAWGARVAALAQSERPSMQVVIGVIGTSGAVETAARDVAEMAERTYALGDQSFPFQISLKIKLASRQRTLSQSMAKDVCLIQANVQAEESRASLQEAIGVFDASLSALRDGFPAFNLPAESDAGLRSQLDYVAELWEEVKPAYVRIASGEEPSAAEMRLIAWQNNQILSKMNAAAFNYEFIATGS
ncbi:MAG: type IV pili methyl-accepting chemotaxis transducer N-terminal domain-containing protein [Pseudomonadota bacterium]